MDINRILAELRAERTNLDAVISALEGMDGRSARRSNNGRRRRRLSAAARKRISDAQKARWAKQKKATKG